MGNPKEGTFIWAHIKHSFFLMFLASLAPHQLRAEDASASLNDEDVAKSRLEEVPEPQRTVQIPVFEHGKWAGYRDEPLAPERKLSSDTEEVTSLEHEPGPDSPTGPLRESAPDPAVTQ